MDIKDCVGLMDEPRRPAMAPDTEGPVNARPGIVPRDGLHALAQDDALIGDDPYLDEAFAHVPDLYGMPPLRPRLPRWLLWVLPLLLLAAGGIAWHFWTAGQSNKSLQQRIEAAIAKNAETAPPTALPDYEAFKFKDVAPEDAILLNAAIPVSADPVIPGKPFKINTKVTGAQAWTSALDCLTATIYYEAASESEQGQRAVAQVVLNRVRHPAFPNSVCGVVFQGSERRTGCQFSFTCDGSLARKPSAWGWARARMYAGQALAGYVEPSVGYATHYHAIYVTPYWSDNLSKIGTIGAHIFYRWQGANGKPGAFASRYTGAEAPPAKFALMGTVGALNPGQDMSMLPPPPETGLSAPVNADNGVMPLPNSQGIDFSPLPKTQQIEADSGFQPLAGAKPAAAPAAKGSASTTGGTVTAPATAPTSTGAPTAKSPPAKAPPTDSGLIADQHKGELIHQ